MHSSHAYLYFGHGAGEPYLPREALLNQCDSPSLLKWSVLMGCSSASLKRHGYFDADGAVYAHVLAGARAAVGNLWDVTDKDIDRFSGMRVGELRFGYDQC